MFNRSIVGFAALAAITVSTIASAGVSTNPDGVGDLFVLPRIVLTDDTANDIRITHRRNFNTGGGGQQGGGGGNGQPRNPVLFENDTTFQAEIMNRLSHSADYLAIQIIPDPLHEYAEGEFEAMTFDTEAGFGIDDLSGEEVPFEALFLDGGTRVVIEFTEGGSFDRNEALSFIFTIQNGSGTDLPLDRKSVV